MHLTEVQVLFIARALADAAHELRSIGNSRITDVVENDGLGVTLTEVNSWKNCNADVADACMLARWLLGRSGEHDPPIDEHAEAIRDLAAQQDDERFLRAWERWRNTRALYIEKRHAESENRMRLSAPNGMASLAEVTEQLHRILAEAGARASSNQPDDTDDR